jgi:hypothetical protein
MGEQAVAKGLQTCRLQGKDHFRFGKQHGTQY